MATILHISDLHRDAGSALTTRSLLESLRLDKNRYVREGLAGPDVAAVSGDIAYGGSADDSNGDAALQAEFVPEAGHTNPYLHMGLHIAIREQTAIDRPQGIRAICERRAGARGAHDAEHAMIDCLAETLWEAQRGNQDPDDASYLRRLRKLPDQRGDVDGQLPFGVTVIGIDADDVELPAPARRRHLGQWVAAGVGLAGIVVLVLVIQPGELVAAFSRFDPVLIPAIVAGSVAYYVLQGVRWHFLLRDVGSNLTVGHTVTLNLVGQITTLLPLGELTRVALASRAAKMPFSDALATVTVQELIYGLLLVVVAVPGLFEFHLNPAIPAAAPNCVAGTPIAAAIGPAASAPSGIAIIDPSAS